MSSNARYVATEALLRFDSENRYSSEILDEALKGSELDKRDSAFAATVFYGTIERRITLDYILSQYSKTPLNKLKKQVLAVLRISLYQILFMERVPNSAAVNEGLKLLDKMKRGFAKGFCNGILRSIGRSLPIDLTFPDIADEIRRISVTASIPQDILKLWKNYYPDDWRDMALSFSEIGKQTTIRVNTLRIDEKSLADRLQKEDVNVEPTKLDNALKISAGDITKLDSFKKGCFHVQDISSQIAARSVGAKKGERILDLCAAPGGKSFTMAELMQNEGSVVSCDIYPKKVKMIDDMASRLGIDIISTVCIDSTVKTGFSEFDRVLCDVPCSGLGIIAKKPEIRYKSINELDNLTEVQYLILCNGAEYLKKNGTLVYSTCTLNINENEKQIERFLSEHDNFELNKSDDGFIPNGMKTFMPHKDGCDGFFVAVMRKKR